MHVITTIKSIQTIMAITAKEITVNLFITATIAITTNIGKLIVAKLSQAPAPAGLSLAVFPNYPATRPDPTRQG